LANISRSFEENKTVLIFCSQCRFAGADVQRSSVGELLCALSSYFISLCIHILPHESELYIIY